MVSAPFRECVCFLLCVGGHISRVGGHSFLWAIQTFSCGGSFAHAFCKCDPNVFCAEDRGFLSEADHFKVGTRFACRCPEDLHLSPCFLALWDHPWIASFVA